MDTLIRVKRSALQKEENLRGIVVDFIIIKEKNAQIETAELIKERLDF